MKKSSFNRKQFTLFAGSAKTCRKKPINWSLMKDRVKVTGFLWMNLFCHFRGVCHMVWWEVFSLFYRYRFESLGGRRVRVEVLLFADRIVSELVLELYKYFLIYLFIFEFYYMHYVLPFLHPLRSLLELDFCTLSSPFQSYVLDLYGPQINQRHQTLMIVSFCHRVRQAKPLLLSLQAAILGLECRLHREWVFCFSVFWVQRETDEGQKSHMWLWSCGLLTWSAGNSLQNAFELIIQIFLIK